MKIDCHILKANATGREAGHFVHYVIEAAPNDTVLDVLTTVYQQYEPDLAFRFACGVARCGECGLLVNGQPCLACDRIVEPELRIEPLGNMPVVRDTVVNRRHVFDQIERILPKGQTVDDMSGYEDDAGHEKIENSIRLTTCYECMICQSVCPRYLAGSDMFAGPLGLLFLAQRQENPAAVSVPEDKVKEITYFCAHCGKCMKYCPAERKPLTLALNLLGCKTGEYYRVNLTEDGPVVQKQKEEATV